MHTSVRQLDSLFAHHHRQTHFLSGAKHAAIGTSCTLATLSSIANNSTLKTNKRFYKTDKRFYKTVLKTNDFTKLLKTDKRFYRTALTFDRRFHKTVLTTTNAFTRVLKTDRRCNKDTQFNATSFSEDCSKHAQTFQLYLPHTTNLSTLKRSNYIFLTS